MKDVATKIAVALGALMFFGIIFSQDFRVSLGLAIDTVLHPLSQFKFHVTILALSVVTAAYSNLIQKYTIDHRRLKELQETMRKYQKEYMEAVKQDNKFKLKQLENQQDEMKRIQAELMTMQFKPMFLTLVVTIPIFAWLWEKATASYSIHHSVNVTLPSKFVESINPSLFNVTVPFSGTINVATPILIFPWWLVWYMLCSVMFGQILKKVMKVGM